jgi:energy-coupling factor transporter ATP-binding protein EcfA2
MPIRRVQVKGFKSIVDQQVELGRVNCFIGANGVGKSNLLEALGVLGAAAGGRVDDEHLISAGVRAGLPRLYKSSFPAPRIPPHITVECEAEPLASFRVSLLNPLDDPRPAWAFKTETLLSGLHPVVRRGVRRGVHSGGNLDAQRGLSALKVVELPAADPAARLIAALQSYAIYTPSTPALRATVADPQTRAPVGLAGGGLAEGFAALVRARAHEEAVDEVLALIDWVSDISTTSAVGELLSPSVPRGRNVLRFSDRFMARGRSTLTAADASEGALYVLFAAVLCLSAASPLIFAIDNLDAALNPRLVARLVAHLPRWLQAANPDRQLLFTAHNPSALDGLDLADDEVRLFAVERSSLGHTTLRRVVLTPALRAQAGEYPLSRLWAMGALGAVPNV